MSGDDETVIVMTNGRVYHTDETCYRITDRARECGDRPDDEQRHVRQQVRVE